MTQGVPAMTASSARVLSPVAPTHSLTLASRAEPNLVMNCRPYQSQVQQLLTERESPPITDHERFLVEAELLFHGLPEPIRRAVLELKSGLGPLPFLVLSGLAQEP